MTLKPDLNARLAARERPSGSPIMFQAWDKLLFMHWEIPAGVLRPLIPAPLEIDTFDGKAWLTVTPLTIYDVGPKFLPAVPYFSRLHELNVRTYVYYNGVPGVWFFSLDANNLLAVLGARAFYCLPYFYARMDLIAEGDRVQFTSSRRSQKAEFDASWTIGQKLPPAEPGSIDFFLVERYSLYAARGKKVYRSRIHHEPWPLQQTLNLTHHTAGVVEADGLAMPDGEPLQHCGGPIGVDVWPLERVA